MNNILLFKIVCLRKHKYKLLFLKSYVVTPYKSHLQSKFNVPYHNEVKYEISTKNGDCLHKDCVFIQTNFLFQTDVENVM